MLGIKSLGLQLNKCGLLHTDKLDGWRKTLYKINEHQKAGSIFLNEVRGNFSNLRKQQSKMQNKIIPAEGHCGCPGHRLSFR